MHLGLFDNHGKKTIKLLESCAKINDNGEIVRGKRVVKTIGPLERFDDGQPNFYERLKESYKKGAPIIQELAGYPNDGATAETIKIEWTLSKEEQDQADDKNLGYFILDSLYHHIGIYDVLALKKSRSKTKIDLNGITRLLIFGRILCPDSKLSTFNDRDKYLNSITTCNDLDDIYECLDFLHNKCETIQKRVNNKIQLLVGRNLEMCYYDVTNFWFCIDKSDDDEVDRKGNIIKQGLRKRGYSKENRRDPIVQMGLFIDDNGLPIAYKLFPGNTNDQSTLRPAIEKIINNMNFGRIIVVADGGLNSVANITYLLDNNNGYIVPQSPRKSTKEVKEWLINEKDYKINDNNTFKVKSIIRKRIVVDYQGKRRKLTEKLVGYWSKAHYDREMYEYESLIKKLNDALDTPNKIKSRTKLQQFLVECQINEETGEVIDNTTKHFDINVLKLDEYKKLFGYYTIYTSEIEKSDDEIINKYKGLSRIEDSFRITKTDLEGRPVFVHKQEHINAHFLICFIALLMVRLIQYNILKYTGKDTKATKNWEEGLSADKIKKALNIWGVNILPRGWFQSKKPDDNLKLILESFNIKWSFGWINEHQLRGLKQTVDKISFR
jgi:transposase